MWYNPERFFIGLLLFLPHCTLNAQEFIVDTDHFSTEDGMSNRFVDCVVEDEQGFMWIGTGLGLNRFDGYNFKWYTKQNSRMQKDPIGASFLDVHSRIWIFHESVKPFTFHLRFAYFKMKKKNS